MEEQHKLIMKKCTKCGFEHSTANITLSMDGMVAKIFCFKCFTDMVEFNCGYMVEKEETKGE